MGKLACSNQLPSLIIVWHLFVSCILIHSHLIDHCSRPISYLIGRHRRYTLMRSDPLLSAKKSCNPCSKDTCPWSCRMSEIGPLFLPFHNCLYNWNIECLALFSLLLSNQPGCWFFSREWLYTPTSRKAWGDLHENEVSESLLVQLVVDIFIVLQRSTVFFSKNVLVSTMPSHCCVLKCARKGYKCADGESLIFKLR